MNEELRERLARLDPMQSGVPVESASSDSARELLEVIMETTQHEQGRQTRRWAGLGAAAALVAVVAVGIGISGGDGTTTTVAGPQSGPPVVLNAGGEDVMASCIMFSVEELAKAPLAFEGTVATVDGATVSLEVDRWFRGGDSSIVTLNAPQGLEALIGGIPFEVGNQYLITAYDGNVNYCGFSGPSTPELRDAFEEAFAS